MDYALSYGCCGLVVLLVASGGQRGALSLPLGTPGGAALCLVAAMGGYVLQTGNACLQKALQLGCPMTTLLPLQAALCVVIGTTANYCLQPDRSDPRLLFSGVFLYVLAILSSSSAQLRHRQVTFDAGAAAAAGGGGDSDGGPRRLLTWRWSLRSSGASASGRSEGAVGADGEGEIVPLVKDSEGIAGEKSAEVEEKIMGGSSPARDRRGRGVGLAVGVLGGLAFVGFTPCFNISVNDQFGWAGRPESGVLSVWAANLIFSISFTLTAFISQMAKLVAKHPGESAWEIARRWYWKSWGRGRAFAVAAGTLCGVANYLQFDGGKRAGFAAAFVVQAFPLVGTLWGVYLFGDYKGAKRATVALLGSTYVFYTAAALLIALSAETGLL